MKTILILFCLVMILSCQKEVYVVSKDTITEVPIGGHPLLGNIYFCGCGEDSGETALGKGVIVTNPTTTPVIDLAELWWNGEKVFKKDTSVCTFGCLYFDGVYTGKPNDWIINTPYPPKFRANIQHK